MRDFSAATFHFFRSSQKKQVKSMLVSHEGVIRVKKALIDFLTEWNDKKWVDWEKIEFVIDDLNSINFWRVLPYSKFLAEAEAKVSLANMETLRKLSF